MKRILIVLFIFTYSFSSTSFADNSSFQKVKEQLFWIKLYNNAYETLYCGSSIVKGGVVEVEHIYPSNWIAASLGCKDSTSCKNDIYREASSDLHNLWPVLSEYKKLRGSALYGEVNVKTQKSSEKQCNFKRTNGKNALLEPRQEVKGMIARSYLYMVHWYNLPNKDLLPLMVKWHIENAPTKEEIKRNQVIVSLQGRNNPFIEVIE